VPVHAEDGGYLAPQGGDVIAVALLAELAEAAEVLAYLRGSESHLPAQLPGGYAVHPRAAQFVELAQISWQPADNVVGHPCLFHGRSHLFLMLKNGSYP